MMNVQECTLPEVRLITVKTFEDSRGFVAEMFQEKRWAEAGISFRPVQENLSCSLRAGTVRGLHFQKKPQAQAKLIRVLKGSIYDVAVDVRPDSPTYGHYVGAELSDENLAQLFIPAGFAHGFCTLTDDVTVLYMMDSFYAPGSEGGILWNDPDLGIVWPVKHANAILSDKDKLLPRFKDLPRLEW